MGKSMERHGVDCEPTYVLERRHDGNFCIIKCTNEYVEDRKSHEKKICCASVTTGVLNRAWKTENVPSYPRFPK